MFFLLFTLLSGLNLYSVIKCENDTGFLATIFSKPIKYFLIILGVTIVSCLVALFFVVNDIMNNSESPLILIAFISYGAYIGFSLMFMFLFAKFSKNRIVNSDDSVTIKNKGGVPLIIAAVIFIGFNLLNIGGNIYKSKPEINAKFEALSKKYSQGN